MSPPPLDGPGDSGARSTEVLIVGGGPAGASAARLLSAWGHRVVVLTREPTRPPLAESLPPSIRKLFGLFDIQAEIDLGGFLSTTGNTVWWGRGEGRSESFLDGTTGYQVVRDQLDGLLLGLAETAGAEVRRRADVRRVDAWEGEEAATVQYRLDGRDHSVRARWVLDCSGRTGVLAKQGLRDHEGGPATVALVAAWDRPGGWDLADPTHTWVESYQDGWAWSVPVSPTRRYVTAMVDPRTTALDRGGAIEKAYRAELRKTEHVGGLVEGATNSAHPWACTASTYSADRYAGRGFLLVGDAASFIDPLSSFGVKKALASAWLAAVVVHTALERSAMLDPSVELFDRREREIVAAYRRLAASFSLEAGRDHAHAFWESRADAVDELAASAFTGEPDLAELRQDPGVLAAFDAIRRAERLRLRQGTAVTVVSAAAVEGREVVLEQRLVAPGFPDGVRFLRGVDLPRLVSMAPRSSQVPDLFEAYCRECAPVILPDFLGALSVLVAKGVLEEG